MALDKFRRVYWTDGKPRLWLYLYKFIWNNAWTYANPSYSTYQSWMVNFFFSWKVDSIEQLKNFFHMIPSRTLTHIFSVLERIKTATHCAMKWFSDKSCKRKCWTNISKLTRLRHNIRSVVYRTRKVCMRIKALHVVNAHYSRRSSLTGERSPVPDWI